MAKRKQTETTTALPLAKGNKRAKSLKAASPTKSPIKKVKSEPKKQEPPKDTSAAAAIQPLPEPVVEEGATSSTSSAPLLKRYLRLILKKQNPDASVTEDSLKAMQDVLYAYCKRLFFCATEHLQSAGKMTLQIGDAKICVQRSFVTRYTPFDNEDDIQFVTSVTAAAEEALERYSQNSASSGVATEGAATGKKSQAEKAGLLLPPVRIRSFCKAEIPQFRNSPESIVYITAALEFIAGALFDTCIRITQQQKRKRILRRVISESVQQNGLLAYIMNWTGTTLE